MSQEPWRFALASTIGTSHVASGLPCQDRSLCEVLETPHATYLVSVICDGAGSAVYSDVGAELASQTLLELVELYITGGGLLRDLSRDIARSWISEISDALSARAQISAHAVRDYACTLLAAIVGPSEAAFMQIGDGAIVVTHGEADGWSYVFWPQHGEYANSTNFVISPNAADALEFEIAPRRIDELAMFSDGIENVVLHLASRTVHAPFFDAMMAPVRASPSMGLDDRLCRGLSAYLSSPSLCARTDDDKTLILASRMAPSVEQK